MDFVSDQLALGRRFRTLNIVDDKSRECLSIEVGTSLTGTQVVRVLDRLVQLRGRPEVIVMDNGPEFTGHALAEWSIEMGIRLHFFRPGEPTENAFADSFNSIFRRECLNENCFLDMADARTAVESWRNKYNDRRPHGSLGKLSPTEYSRRHGLALDLAE
jgi:putative transposase